jgi:hypothetical protein
MGIFLKNRNSANSIPIALSFFAFWLIVLYLGADHPVPRGFIWIIIMDFILSIIVCWRSSIYLDLIKEGKKGRKSAALIDGIVTGLALSVITLIMSLLRNDVKFKNGFIDLLIWISVITVLGGISSLCVYAVCGVVVKLRKK